MKAIAKKYGKSKVGRVRILRIVLPINVDVSILTICAPSLEEMNFIPLSPNLS